MKKIIYMLIQLSLFAFSFSSCLCNIHAGLHGASGSISRSKSIGVFVCEYEARPNPYYINDTIYFTINEAWLEKRWFQTEDFKASPRQGYQLIIDTKENIDEKYPQMNFEWTIGVDWKRNFRSAGRYGLMSDFDSLPTAEREVWEVMKGRDLREGDKQIIGEFILYKKK